MKFTVKNWAEFQHYKDRSPPWVKLHKSLLDDYDFQCLPVASRALAPMLWLLASENMDGIIDCDTKRLAFRLRALEKEIKEGLEPLIRQGFLIPDSGVLAECQRVAVSETETETETETKAVPKIVDDRFEKFWKAYPRKQGKGAAEKAWKRIHVNGAFGSLLTALENQKQTEQWRKDNGQFIPNPATWLNQRRWEDEIPGGNHPDGTSSTNDIFRGVL
jgi:hypothetical protein